MGELEQVLRARVGVRPGVEENGGAASRGQDDGDRGPHHAGQPADVEQARREHRAGVAGGDDCVGTPVGDEPARDDERAVGLRADGLGGLLVHRERVGRLDELEPLRVEPRRPDEHDVDPLAGGLDRACDDLLGRAIAAEGVDRYASHYGAWMRSGSTSRPL